MISPKSFIVNWVNEAATGEFTGGDKNEIHDTYVHIIFYVVSPFNDVH